MSGSVEMKLEMVVMPVSDADRAKEKEFLARHGAELKAYEGRVLNPIAQRWFRNNAAVRKVEPAKAAQAWEEF